MMAIAAFVLLGSVANAQVNLSGSPQFINSPDLYASSLINFGGIGLQGNLSGPGTGSFVHNEVLSSLPDGFKLSQASFTYTTTLSDVGNDLYMGWKIFRMAQVDPGAGPGGINVVLASAGLDGSLTATSGAGIISLEQQTVYLGEISGGNALQHFDGSSFTFDGSFVNTFSATSSALETVHYGTSLLQQTFEMYFHPTAAGEVITLTLPDSSESHLNHAPVSTPEPGSLAILGGLGATGVLSALRRRRAARG